MSTEISALVSPLPPFSTRKPISFGRCGLALFLSLGFALTDTAISTIVLPWLTQDLSSDQRMLWIYGASCCFDYLAEYLWKDVSDFIRNFWFDVLFQLQLDKKELDSLRKNSSLDTVLSILVTKLPSFAMKQVTVLWPIFGIWSMFLPLLLISANVSIKYGSGQQAAMQENWEKGVELQNSL